MTAEKDPCTMCSASGRVDCLMCEGTGRQSAILAGLQERGTREEKCLLCHGIGKTKCLYCNGTGHTLTIVPDIETHFDSSSVSRFAQTLSASTFSVFSDGKVERWETPPKVVSHFDRITEIKIDRPYSADELKADAILGVVIAIGVSVLFLTFGIERTLVAGEALFIFAAWTGLRFLSMFRQGSSGQVSSFVGWLAIGFGACSGLLAFYLMLTGYEGEVITRWVTESTLRIVGSLFASLFALGLLEVVWRKVWTVVSGRFGG